MATPIPTINDAFDTDAWSGFSQPWRTARLCAIVFYHSAKLLADSITNLGTIQGVAAQSYLQTLERSTDRICSAIRARYDHGG